MAKFSTFLKGEALEVLIGKKIGQGAYRYVYHCRIDPKLVVKFEGTARNFANAHEYDIWMQLQHTAMEKWVAPCRFISPCGSVLLQDKTTPVLDKKDLPRKVPELFGDLKQDNWGWLNGRVVCHDYGNFKAVAGWRLKKADW